MGRAAAGAAADRGDRPVAPFRGELAEHESPASLLPRRLSFAYTYLDSGLLAKLDDHEADEEARSDITRQDLFAARKTTAVRRAWRLTEALLRAVKAEVGKAGSRLMLVAAPAAYQVHDEEARRLARSGPRDGPGLDLTAPDRRLGEIAERIDVPFFDLLPALQKAAATSQSSGARLHYRQDPHWTSAGNRVAATAIESALLERPDLLPPACRPAG